MALTLKFRPKSFAEVVGQDAVVGILSTQIAKKKFKNAYLFAGAHGCGKTSTARIFANEVNRGEGEPIEIDAASHNGVDDVRSIITDAQQPSIDCDYKTYIIDECVSGDTEILTSVGWKRFDALCGDETVAQYGRSGEISFVKPSEFIEMDYCGDMYEVCVGNKAKFLMSPNHIQPLLYRKSNKVREKYVKDTKFCQTNAFLRAGWGVDDSKVFSSQDALALCLQADGTLQETYPTYNYWTIQLTRERKKLRIKRLLEECGFWYRELKTTRKNSVRYAIKTDTSITKTLSTHFSLSDMGCAYADSFIKELMEWDGHIAQGKYYYYSCVNKENADFCQAVGILGGYSSRVSVETDSRKDTYKDVYRVYLKKSYRGNWNKSVSKEAVQYSGKIYCVKVPTHMIIIRRNGYEIVTGNCHNFSKAAWDCALKLIEEPPKHAIFIFCTTAPSKIPMTILSRVQRFDFYKVPSNIIADRLEFILNEECNATYERYALEMIANLADGHIRDAVQYLEKCLDATSEITVNNVETILGLVDSSSLIALEKCALNKDLKSAISELDNVNKRSFDLLKFFDSLLEFAIDCSICAKTGENVNTTVPSELVKELSDKKDLATQFMERLVVFRRHCDNGSVIPLLKALFVEVCK